MSRCTCTRGGSVVTAVTYGVLRPFRMPPTPNGMRSVEPSCTGRDAYRGLVVPTSNQSADLWPKASAARVRQERHLAGVLDRAGEQALLLGRDPGDTAAADLAPVG